MDEQRGRCLEDNTQHMEMLEQGTQGHSQAPGKSMWEDFTCAVRNLPACEARGGSTEDRLPCRRRDQGQRSHMGLEEVPKTFGMEIPANVDLKLNLAPEKHNKGDAVRGRGRSPAGRRGMSRGSGRGTGRMRRPPAVQPRHHLTASDAHYIPIMN